jgi:hypothetical protein
MRSERSAARIAPGAVQSFEDRRQQQLSARSAKLLTYEERSDLLYEWGGYGSSNGSRSSFGAIMDAALRAPPRERPVWGLVSYEIEKRGGRLELESLVKTLAEEGCATRHEVRMAVRQMCGAGRIVKYVQDMPRKNEKGDQILLPTEMVKLQQAPKMEWPEALTPQERWRRQDEELRAFCDGEVPCHETRSVWRGDHDPNVLSRAANAMGNYMASLASPPHKKLFGLDRMILERVYGTSHHAPYRDVFGKVGDTELAPVIEYTKVAIEAQARMGEGKTQKPTMWDVLRAILDDIPEGLAAQVRWREERSRFIRTAVSEARKLLETACEAYRNARSG